MRSSNPRLIKDLLTTENEHLKKLNDIVCQAVEQENLLLNSLANPPIDKISGGQRMADSVARFGGSWKFIILFAVVIIVWIIYNLTLPAKERFDPFPFILLNLVLSCLAALQAPVIMMSQNRQEEKDRLRNENDYLINLKAEIEIRTLHQKMDLLLQDQFKQLIELQAEQLRILQSLVKQEKHEGKKPNDH